MGLGLTFEAIDDSLHAKSPTVETMRLSVNLNTLHTLPSDSGAGLQVLLFWRIVNFTGVFQLGPT